MSPLFDVWWKVACARLKLSVRCWSRENILHQRNLVLGLRAFIDLFSSRRTLVCVSPSFAYETRGLYQNLALEKCSFNPGVECFYCSTIGDEGERKEWTEILND